MHDFAVGKCKGCFFICIEPFFNIDILGYLG